MTNEATAHTTLYLNYEADEFVCATVVSGGEPIDGLTGMDRDELSAYLKSNKPTSVVIVDESGEHGAN